MHLGNEQYQIHDSYFFVIDLGIYDIIGIVGCIVLILFFVRNRRKKKTIN